MAEILDQSAIDELLSGSFDDDMSESSSDDQDTSASTTETTKSGKRLIKPENRPRLRFDYKYKSPVLKKEQIQINPDIQQKQINDEPVVWTLNAYNANRKKLNK